MNFTAHRAYHLCVNLRRIVPLGIALFVVASPHTEAQSDAARGRTLLQHAIAVAGGREALLQLDRWVISGGGRENLAAEWQGRGSADATWREHRETVAVVTGAVAWERRTPRNDNSLRWRRFIYRPDMAGYIDWNAGVARLTPPGAPEADRLALARRVPHVLLGELALNNAGARFLRPDGESDVIQTSLTDATPVRVFVSRMSGALMRIEYDVFLPGLGDSVVSWSWDGWITDAGLGMKPTRQTVAVNGTTYQEVTFTRYEAGATDAGSFVEVSEDLKTPATPMSMPAPPAAAGPASGEIAPGVHVRSIQGFNVMAIVGKDSVIAVEAPEAARGLESIPASNAARAGRVALEHLRWLDSAFPGRRLSHLIVTHHHGDHIGGAPLIAARGATVIVSDADVAAARAALAAPRGLAPWPAAPSRSRSTVELVADRRVINDGVRDIEIINVGENPHSLGNLLVWLPRERILFQGDLFYFDEGAAFPPAGRDVMNRFFAQWLHNRGIMPRMIYGVHNYGAAGADALARVRGRN